MKIYGLTKLGKSVSKSNSDEANSEEMAVLKYLRSHKTASEDEIEINCGGKWTLRTLKERGLIKELSS